MAINIRKEGEGDDSPDEQEEQSPDIAPTDQDPFLRGSMRTINWMSENQNLVYAGIIGLVLVGVGVYAGFSYMRQQKVAAAKGVSKSVAEFQVPIEGSKSLQKLKSSDRMAPPDRTFESDEKRWQAVYERAGETLDNHTTQKVAQPARLMRGAAAVSLGKYDEAVELYETYLDKDPSERELPRAYYALAVAYGSKGDTKKAVKQLDKLTEINGDLEAFALYHKGLFYQEAGNKEKAKKMFNKVLETDSKSPYKNDIERRLGLM